MKTGGQFSIIGRFGIELFVHYWNNARSMQHYKESVKEALDSGSDSGFREGFRQLCNILELSHEGEFNSGRIRLNNAKEILHFLAFMFTPRSQLDEEGTYTKKLYEEACREIGDYFRSMFREGNLDQIPMPESGRSSIVAEQQIPETPYEKMMRESHQHLDRC